MSSRSYVPLIKSAQKKGYRITLVFLYLESANLAIERVKTRVQEGGHTIPVDIILRRYEKGLINFNCLYINTVDRWMIFDNSSNPSTFVAEGIKGAGMNVFHEETWERIRNHER